LCLCVADWDVVQCVSGRVVVCCVLTVVLVSA